ncbi:hypothetical protein CJU89_2172 [Yarrowia sp. B02]|nr:hypothetical protein CJU89_2172 [Yarrowia sp. B02]
MNGRLRPLFPSLRRGIQTLATGVTPAQLPTYYNASKPCLLDFSSFGKLKANEKWALDGRINNEYFESIIAKDGVDPAVGVEKGRMDRDAVESGGESSDFQRFEMPLSFFLQCINHEVPQFRDLYLAQTYLTDSLPSLKEDLSPNPFLENASVEAIGFWIGRNTFTPPHYDPSGNIYMMVLGSKKVRLWKPQEKAPLGTAKMGSNFNFQTGKPDYEVTLEHGQVLFTPQGWFHELESKGLSAAVNWWFRLNNSS